VLNPAVFKAYDVRGLYPSELDEEGAYAVGRAYVELFQPSRIAVGHDMRVSSPPMADALIRGASEAGAEVLELGLVGTEMVYLAVGELLLVLPGRTVTRMAAATMLFLTFAAAAAVLAARVDGAELARAGATPPNDALEGTWPKVMAIALNSVGTAVLLVGSIASARRRGDPRPLLVAAGVAVIAAASTATRAGSYALFALGQAAGITLILLGLVTRRLGPR